MFLEILTKKYVTGQRVVSSFVLCNSVNKYGCPTICYCVYWTRRSDFFYLNRAEPIALCTPISLTVYIGTVLFSVKKLSNPLVQNILQCSTICVGYWLFQHNIKELI